MAISSLLNVSRDALMSYQGAIQITGSNIANVSNADYTRQRAVLTASSRLSSGEAGLQTSVSLSGVDRIYDRFIEAQILDATTSGGYCQTRSDVLGQVEILFNETAESGLGNDLVHFWNAWGSLASEPSGLVERNALISAADTLASGIGDRCQSLQSLRADVGEAVVETVAKINSLAADVASLNDRIVSISMSGGGVNDLLDKRAAALNDLAQLLPIQSVEVADGSVNVFTAGGEMLVGSKDSRSLSATGTDIVFSGVPGVPLNDRIGSGRLGALLELRDGTLPGYMNRLDQLATALVTEVNAIHANGVDATGAPVVGTRFFSDLPVGTSAALSMKVDAGILADPSTIVASQAAAGDGEVARRISALNAQAIVTDGGGLVKAGSHWAATVGLVAGDVSTIQRRTEHSEAVLNQLQSKRESVSGVAVDEEMVLLIQYQLGYAAAGRLCSAAEDMLETLMKLVD